MYCKLIVIHVVFISGQGLSLTIMAHSNHNCKTPEWFMSPHPDVWTVPVLRRILWRKRIWLREKRKQICALFRARQWPTHMIHLRQIAGNIGEKAPGMRTPVITSLLTCNERQPFSLPRSNRQPVEVGKQLVACGWKWETNCMHHCIGLGRSMNHQMCRLINIAGCLASFLSVYWE